MNPYRFAVVSGCAVVALVACSAGTAVVDPVPDGGDDRTAALDAASSADGSAVVDARAVDAGIDGSLPPALAKCSACLTTTCQPEASACLQDPTCSALLECTVRSGCLGSGAEPAVCVQACGDELGLTRAQLAQQTAVVAAVANACASCLPECRPADAGGSDAARDGR